MSTKCCSMAELRFHFPILIHQSLDPAAQAPSSLPCLCMHSSAWQPQNGSTRHRGLRVVEVIICMITREFSVISIDVTGLSLSLYLSTLAKKIEKGTQAKERRVHARQITRLCQVRGCLNFFFGQGSMVKSSITDHILKRSSFWLALTMPIKFGIVGKLLVKHTRENFPSRERRWHIWITSSSQSPSADWLSDSNGRSLWPISAAFGSAAATVSTVLTVTFAFLFAT